MHAIRAAVSLALLGLVSSPAIAQDWAQSVGGSWHDPLNWNPQSVPDGVGAAATIADTANGGPLTGSGFFTLDNTPITLGSLTIALEVGGPSLNFNNGTITLDNGGGADVSITTSWALGGMYTDLVLMGHLVTDWQASNLTIWGDISGNHGITKRDYGVLQLKGNNTYTGETIIEGGDIWINGDGQLGDSSMGTRVLVDAELAIINSPGITITAESLTLDGGALRGDNSDWAATITLVGSGIISPFHDPHAFTVSGKITGDAPLRRRSAGSQQPGFESVLTLTNPDNDYTGGTTIEAGVLRIADDGALGLGGTDVRFQKIWFFSEGPPSLLTYADVTIPRNIVLVDDGWLRAEPGTTGTYSGLISDLETLTIGDATTGATGTVALTNDNTYGAAGGTWTIVKAGTLLANNVSGSATGPGDVVVESGAVLGGTGTIAGSVAAGAGATVAPGASAGILTVGAASFDPTATLAVELSGTLPGEHDQLLSGGAIALDGTLQVTLLDYQPQLGDTFEVVVASGLVSGQFASTDLPPGMTVAYQADRVVLEQTTLPCVADLDGDTTVAVGDLLMLLAAWGTPAADLNGDGNTDVSDLLALLAAWGAC